MRLWGQSNQGKDKIIPHINGGLFFLFFFLWWVWVGGEVREEGMELAEEFVAGVFGADLFEPAWVWLAILRRDDFDNIAVVELSIERDHLAVYDSARAGCANLAMEAIGEVEWHRVVR